MEEMLPTKLGYIDHSLDVGLLEDFSFLRGEASGRVELLG